MRSIRVSSVSDSKCRRALRLSGFRRQADLAQRHHPAPAEQQHPNRRSGVVPRGQKGDARGGTHRDDPAHALGIALRSEPFGTLLPMDFEHDFVISLEPFGRDGHPVAGRKDPRIGRHDDVLHENENPVLVRRTGPEDRPGKEQEQHLFHSNSWISYFYRHSGGVFPGCAESASAHKDNVFSPLSDLFSIFGVVTTLLFISRKIRF